MEPTRKRSLGFYFSPKVRAFHVVVKLNDVPGALSSVLELLSSHLDLVASVRYSLDSGGAIWSGFGKSLSKAETAGKLKKLVERSPMVVDCEVKASDRGLLVDSFHTGIEVAPDRPGIVLPLAGVSRMYGRLAEVFGSGGETILFEEGSALGESSGKYLNAKLGQDSLDWKVKALLGMYTAYGWGSALLTVEKPRTQFRLVFRDCFECAGTLKKRSGCNFLRGHLASTVSTMSGTKFEGKETKCRFRGDATCEFLLSVKKA